MTTTTLRTDDRTTAAATAGGTAEIVPSHPALGPWVELHTETGRQGHDYRLVVNRRDGHAIQLDADEMAFCRRLDGATVAPSDARTVDLVDELWRTGFFTDRPGNLDTVEQRSPTERLATAIATLDVHWNGADRAVAFLYRHGARWAFHPIAVAAQVMLAVLGAVALVAVVGDQPLRLRASMWDVPLLIAIDLVAIAVHEAAHALVIHRHGRTVQSAGLRLHLGVPAFYVESVDALLLTRRQRMVQAAAGPWAEWLVTAVAAVALWQNPSIVLSYVLYRFVILNTLTIVSNLAPFSGLDGYLLFADAVGEPDLARRSRHAVGELLAAIRDSRRPARAQIWLACYAVLNAAFAVTLVVLAVFFWYQLFGDLIDALLAHGPLGWLVASTAGVIMARPTFLAVARAVAVVATRVRHLAARTRFRIERRWRIDATRQLFGLPQLAGLDDLGLGVVAGQLQRLRLAPQATIDDRDFDGLVLVRSGRGRVDGSARSAGAIWSTGEEGLRLRCDRSIDLVLAPRSSLDLAARVSARHDHQPA